MKTLGVAIASSLVTAAVLTGIAFGRSHQHSGTPKCGIRTQTTGSIYGRHDVYVCTLRSMPTYSQAGFELRLPVIDARCTAYAADAGSNLPAMFACERLSLP